MRDVCVGLAFFKKGRGKKVYQRLKHLHNNCRKVALPDFCGKKRPARDVLCQRPKGHKGRHRAEAVTMVYEYEFSIDGRVMRRKARQFNNGVMKLMAEDIAKIDRHHSDFLFSVKRWDSWDKCGVEITEGKAVAYPKLDFK